MYGGGWFGWCRVIYINVFNYHNCNILQIIKNLLVNKLRAHYDAKKNGFKDATTDDHSEGDSSSKHPRLYVRQSAAHLSGRLVFY